MSVPFLEGLREERLDNGLRVLVRPVRTAPLVSVWCWYHVGSKDESPGMTGASHFVEHMNFKGTDEISREDLKVWIERAGGTWNGYTWVDQTTYFETLAAEQLDLALHIESSRMTGCTYDADELEHERTVVMAELRGNANNPGYLLDIEVTAAALRMHPYRWPVIGWQSDLETMSRDQLLDHYRTWYVPSNATLVVAGDVDPDAALAAVERRFGDIPPGDPPKREPVREPEQIGERRVVLERPGTTAYLQVVYRAPEVGHPDFVPLLMADAVLSGGKGVNLWSGGFGRGARTTTPLYQALVERELVVAVTSAVLPTELPYLYGISATLRDGVAHRDVEHALYSTIDATLGDGLSGHALHKAKNQVLSSLAFESERITDMAHQLGFFATVASVEKLDALSSQVQAATGDQVIEVARRHLRPERRTVGWFVPQEAP